MTAAEASARAIECPAGTVLEWAPGLTREQYEPGGERVPVPLAGARLPGPRFTPPGRELAVIDADGVETLCASPDEALAHMRTLIEDLAVRLARQYPAHEELAGGMPPTSSGSTARSRPVAWTCRCSRTRPLMSASGYASCGPTHCAGMASS